MKKFILVFLLLKFCLVEAQTIDTALITPFEKSAGKQSATYTQAILFYTKLSNMYKTISLKQFGKTDGGYDLYVVYYCSKINSVFSGSPFWDKNNDVVMLINNDIHPGEPDGVDACMMLLRDAAMGKYVVPDNIVLAVIPIYNVGGALNRNSNSRINQNGPEEYGFRGNAKNLDLNRDFIKQDANETVCLEKLFNFLDPDIFIDNHVSDGADYKHVMTLLATQHNKLGGILGKYMNDTYTPKVYKEMKKQGFDVIPYVSDFDVSPDNGWREFYDPPRFSSGYAALFQTMAFVPETHMLKPFKQRVESTYSLMQSFIKVASTEATNIKHARNKDKQDLLKQTVFPLDWKCDTTKCDSILFSGYESEFIPNKVSGLPRQLYNHDKPFTKNVAFFNQYIPSVSITAPKAYIIPKEWNRVIDILYLNSVRFTILNTDTIIDVTAYHLDNYESTTRPYESHYMHKKVQVSKHHIKKIFRKGDYVIDVNQASKRFLIETVEPMAPDAFFVWNFFDGILQQKEYFSDYVFADLAPQILEQDSKLKNLFESKRKHDTIFAKNSDAQLDFIYRNSNFMETEYLQYPVFRIE